MRTADYWHEWLAHGDFPDHPWRPFLQRSALTLKGLSYAPTGAMVAAATTSLPETPRGERNWDYRYSWIRDSTFMLWGLYTLGFDWEANDFFYFIADVAGSEHDLQIMYGIGGERLLEESVLDHLDGYEGAKPVRIGNGAYAHRQHDVWGTILDSFYLHTKSRDGLPDRFWPILCKQVEMAITHWREPDRGIWEVRGEPKHFTSSKVMCWVACDRGARLARMRDEHEQAERWQAAADEIHADVLEHGIDERGVFVQHYETTALDASLLLLPLVRFLPPEDARVRATVMAIADELTVDGLVLRYKVEETDDGLAGEEGTFAICSFWLVSALAEIGESSLARELCERMLSFASPLLLYAEEIDPRSGRHLGNFPQAFTHLALINAVMHVIRADSELATTQAPLTVRQDPGTAAEEAIVTPTGRDRRAGRRGRRQARGRRDGQPHQRRPGAVRRRPHRAVRRVDAAARLRAARRHAGQLGQVHLWLADERCVPEDDQESNTRMLRETLLDRLRAQDGPHLHHVRGDLSPEDAAWLYGCDVVRAMGERPMFDMILLGMGPDGHTASLFPGHPEAESRGRAGHRRARQPQAAAGAHLADDAGAAPRALHAAARHRRGQGARRSPGCAPGTPRSRTGRLGDGLDEIVCDPAAAGG